MKTHLKRIIISAILVFALSCGVALAEDEETMQAPAEPVSIEQEEVSEEEVFAEDEEAPVSDEAGDAEPAETETADTESTETTGPAESADEVTVEPAPVPSSDDADAADSEESSPVIPKADVPEKEEEPEPEVHEAKIVEEDGSLYYIDPETGEKRTEAGFITYDGKQYYIQDGGVIAVSKTVHVDDDRYHADASGAIMTGVHKWKGLKYYSSVVSGKLKSVRGFVNFNGRKYHVYNSGKVAVKKFFGFEGKLYIAGTKGPIYHGVHKWNDYYYYSGKKSGAIRTSQGLATWNKKQYFIEDGGKIRTCQPFFYKDTPYVSLSTGWCRRLTNINAGRVISKARKQVGIMTGVKYWQWYYGTRFVDTDRTPWCGAFVAWCYHVAGKYSKVAKVEKYGNLGYVPSYSRYANANNKWVNRSSARGGDIIIFGSDMHVGLVEYVGHGYVYTIEGNAGPTAAVGCGKPGAVIRRLLKLDDPRIKGILRV